MDKIKLYENLEKLSIHVYEPNNKPIPQGWQLFQIRGNSVQDVTQQLKNILNRYR